MSSRALRRLRGGNKIPEPESDEDVNFEPLYASQTPKINAFNALKIESSSDSEHEAPEHDQSEDDSDQSDECKIIVKRNKKKEKKKKRKTSKINDEMDEIDKFLQEIDISEPIASSSSSSKITEEDEEKHIFSVQFKYLNPGDEMTRRFGPEPLEPGAKKRGRQPFLRSLLKKTSLVADIGSFISTFHKNGLSMSLETKSDDGCYYFTFDHDQSYFKVHQKYLQNYVVYDDGSPTFDNSNIYHIETVVKVAHLQFMMEEYSDAIHLIEIAVAYMQYVSHPWFNLASSKTRLLYNIMENRIFHIVILKYIYLLTNRACHRTALELAKVLLNIDPSDPLAVLLIIDTLAIRAKEYEWFLKATKHLYSKRQAGYLFNMQYSSALARFQLAMKKKEDTWEADKLLQEALLNYPLVAKAILESASTTFKPRAKESQLFAVPENRTPKKMNELIMMYAKLIWHKWREPKVMAWLHRNCEELAIKHDESPEIQARAKHNVTVYFNLFHRYPKAVIRHLVVIKPLSQFVCEGAVPVIADVKDELNPLPPSDNINRYRYNCYQRLSEQPGHPLFDILMSLFDFGLVHTYSRDGVNVRHVNRLDLPVNDEDNENEAEEDEGDEED